MSHETLPPDGRTAARWPYVIAAVASIVCSFVILQGGESRAFDPDEASFVPTTPCRLFDTRPGDVNIGFRSDPLPADTEIDVAVTGTHGECVVPADATAVSINLTGLDATSPTFVAIWPAGADNPGTSALNLLPGQVPTPNKIEVQLSDDGAVTLYNAFGSVHLIGDVMGYYTDGNLTELDARVEALEDAAPVEGGVPQAVLDRLDALETDVADLEAANAGLESANAVLEADVAALTTRVATLEANEDTVEDEIIDLGGRMTSLENVTDDMSVVMVDGERTVRFEGVNVQVVNGLGSTGVSDGSGNLIVGYNAQRPGTAAERTGSHNLIVGDRHEYISYGGAVFGYQNSIWGPSNSVVGGTGNAAGLGSFATVSGGSSNTASGYYSSVSGGYGGAADGGYSSVSGGRQNVAQGAYSSILGGREVATIASQTIGLGTTNNAISVVGGYNITCGVEPTANYDTCYDLNNWYAANQG
ncbi:MAG: hypothetical protein R8G01_04500 [Ilumatobacteraceae bacterium]|nr:hypothetical protein [Ilumatobacteraceae bacterium]